MSSVPAPAPIHRAKWDVALDADGIVQVVVRGEKDENEARAYLDDIEAVAAKAPSPVRILADASAAGRSTPAARQVLATRPLLFGDAFVAVVGLRPWNRVLIRFVFRIRKIPADRLRTFDTLEEGRAWLRAIPTAPPSQKTG
ncbi:MAG: STAS/SEC14 domain-containing protein [Methanobacteriota archaeon]